MIFGLYYRKKPRRPPQNAVYMHTANGHMMAPHHIPKNNQVGTFQRVTLLDKILLQMEQLFGQWEFCS